MSDEIREASLRYLLDKTIEFKHDFLSITFFGGEPLLRFDVIPKSVDFLKKLVESRRSELPEKFDLRFGINTNGTLLNDEIIEYIGRENFYIYISLDGPASRHDISRRTVNNKGSFEALKPFIPALVKLNAFPISVTTRKNIAQLTDSVKWIKEQGFSQVQNMVDCSKKKRTIFIYKLYKITCYTTYSISRKKIVPATFSKVPLALQRTEIFSRAVDSFLANPTPPICSATS